MLLLLLCGGRGEEHEMVEMDENNYNEDTDAASYRWVFSNPNQTITLTTVLLSLLTILAITGRFSNM